MGKRIAYGLLGFAVGAALILPVYAVRAQRHWGFVTPVGIAFCISCGALTTWCAERKGKVKSVRDLQRPTSLFPRS